jgi:transposase
LAESSERRDWRIYHDLAQILIREARILYRNDNDFELEIENTIYALDSSTIDLCLNIFRWAPFRRCKGAIKLHTLLDVKTNIPTFIEITDGKVHDVNILDQIEFEAGAFYVMDRGYLDFMRLYKIHLASAFFVTRAKTNTKWQRIYSHRANRQSGVICDQTIRLTGFYAEQDYPEKLRRIKYFDAEEERYYVFLTNNFTLEAKQIAELYRHRWRIEIFFKWIKQHLEIKSFWGYSRNAVQTQIWIAVSTYVLIAILKKKLGIQNSLYDVLQILSTSPFEKTPLRQLFYENQVQSNQRNSTKQLKLLNI